jgi:small subunit ribosomal protein S2
MAAVLGRVFNSQLFMKPISLQDLLETGAHFGHQVNRWNPKMQPYIYTARDGVHVFDLTKTKEGLEVAGQFLKEIAARSGLILWLGTKRQAQAIVKEAAVALGNPHITQRWIGGLLTNFNQVHKSIDRMQDLKAKKAAGELSHYTKKEQLLIDRQVLKLERFFGGLTDLVKLPEAIIVIDTHREDTAVREANRLGIPVVGIIDTNADPDMVTYGIPANDDAVKSIEFVVKYLGEAVAEGQAEAKKVSESAEVKSKVIRKPAKQTSSKTQPIKKSGVRPGSAITA